MNGMEKITDADYVENITHENKPEIDSPEEPEILSNDSDSKNVTIVQKLVQLLKKTKDQSLLPSINFEKNQVFYPILKEIGIDEYDTSFLKNMTVTSSTILEKHVYERITVCSEHPENLTTSVRFYCPKCQSSDIKKLSLVEHKVCGYIDNIEKFGAKNILDVTKCHNCKNPIRNPKRELRMLGMWYFCNQCEKKFDDVTIKLHCRQFNHDFDILHADYVPIPYYSLKRTFSAGLDVFPLISKLGKALEYHGFQTEEFAKVNGKSGIEHQTSLYGHNKDKKIIVFVRSSEKTIEDTTVNAMLADVLDISPDLTILVCIPNVSERSKSIASSNGISVITGTDYDKILDSVKKILSQTVWSNDVK